MPQLDADPTMELLKRLDDESYWDHIDRGVPVFRPHKAKHFNPETGKNDLEVDYDLAKLQRMVDKLNVLRDKFGVVPRMILGHTRKTSDQEDQPEMVGYWANPRLGNFGPAKQPAILMDRYFMPGCWEKSKTYPYRSPEFYPEEVAKFFPGEVQPEDEGVITAISLLKTDPKLDMGMTVYAKSPLCYGRFEWDDNAMDTTNTPENQDPTKIPGVPDDNANTEEQQFMGRFKTCMSKCFPHYERYYKEHVSTKYETMACPSSTSELPGTEKDKPEKEHMSASVPTTTPTPVPAAPQVGGSTPAAPTAQAVNTADVLRQYSEQRAIEQAQYQRTLDSMQAEIAQLKAQNAAKEREAVLAQYERDIGHLISQGYVIDLPKTMAFCKSMNMDQPSFDSYKELLKVNCSRAPIGADLGKVDGKPIVPDSVLTKTGKTEPELTKEDEMPLAMYHNTHPGKSFQENKRDYLAQKGGRPMAAAA